MISLEPQRDPYWIALVRGVRVQVRPLTAAMDLVAQAQAREEMKRLDETEEVVARLGLPGPEMPDLRDAGLRDGVFELLFAQALARVAILAWDGVEGGMDENGRPTPDAIDALMRLPLIPNVFVLAYRNRLATIAAEGNGSGPGPNGRPAPGPNGAPPATRAPVAPAPAS